MRRVNASTTILVNSHVTSTRWTEKDYTDTDASCPGHPDIIETRFHVLNECEWYARRVVYDYEQIEDFILFLIDNPLAFSFTPLTKPRMEDKDWAKYVTYTHSLRNSQRALIGLPPTHTPIFIGERSIPTFSDLRTTPRIINRITSLNPYTVTIALESYFEENDFEPILNNRMSGGNPHA
jgi:hypothetical protein